VEITAKQYATYRRVFLGMTQTQFAELLDVDIKTIQRREKGETPISREAEIAIRSLVFGDRGVKNLLAELALRPLAPVSARTSRASAPTSALQ
jgi:transcriptional regulator with XRE-family HTH domain